MLIDITIKEVRAKDCVVTVGAEDIVVPIISTAYEPVFTTETDPQKIAKRTEARTQYRNDMRAYLKAYFEGRDHEEKANTPSATIKAIEGQTFPINI